MHRARLLAPLLLALALTAGAPLLLEAQTADRSGESGSGSLFGVFIPMPEGAGSTASRAAIVNTPSISSGVPTAEYLRSMTGSDYVAQPGDVYRLALVYYAGTGGETAELTVQLAVEEDGSLQLPLAGAVPAKGKSLGELRKLVAERIGKAVAVVHVQLWLESPALFQVFVSGAVATPGFVVANGLMRVSDALRGAGGLLEGASLRAIRLRRGAQERVVDLLSFAAGHDLEGNPLLASRDSIAVPAAETGAQVQGSVRYPGAYELLPGETLADLLDLAGGLAAGADGRAVSVARIDTSGKYVVIRLSVDADAGFEIRNGDVVTVPSAARNTPAVSAEGALFGKALEPAEPVKVPDGPVSVLIPFSPGLTVLGVLEKLGGPTPLAVGGQSFVVRAATGEKSRFDATSLWATRDPRADLVLEPGDRVVVPFQTLNVAVRGEVVSAGFRTYVSGYTVADYIRASGGIHPTRGSPSIIRITTAQGATRRAGLDEEPAPGDTVTVGRQPVTALSDFFSAYVFPVTTVVVGLVSAATTIWNFVNRF